VTFSPGTRVMDIRSRKLGTVKNGSWSGDYIDKEQKLIHVEWDDGDRCWIEWNLVRKMVS
jgi:hypothetical protein